VRLACVTVLLAAAWWVGGSLAGAAAVGSSGWWWEGNQSNLPAAAPVPPSVPPDGLYIASTAQGASAIAAVQFSLAEGESAPVLTLKVAANGEQGGDVAVIAACPSGSAWGGGSASSWDAKPSVACNLGSVAGQRDATAGTWTFPLAPLVTGNEVDVVLTPGVVGGAPDGAPPVYPTFSLAVEKVTDASLATTPGGSTSTGEFDTSQSGFDPATEGGGLALGPTFADDTGLTAFSPALPSSAQGVTATAPVVRQATAANVLPIVPKAAGGSGLAFLVILATMAVAYRLNRLPLPSPRRLGPMAASAPHTPPPTIVPDTGGLGRFARRRTGAPPSLV
jgi:hypothetical protein